MPVAYSFPGASVSPVPVWGVPLPSGIGPYVFDPVTVIASDAVTALAAIGAAACSQFTRSPPPGFLYCGVDSTNGATGVTLVIANNASWSQPAGYSLTSLPVDVSTIGGGGSSGGTVSGTVSLASGSTIKLDAGPTYSYADIVQFWGIALLALTAVWCVRQFVLKLVTPQ